MSESEVVIVIVTYKSAALTIDCLHSVEAERQASAPGLKIRAVVVDNASGDAPPIAAAIEAQGWSSWVRLVTAERNGGFAYGNNVGIRTACEDSRPAYFHLVNPDTLLRPGSVKALVDFFDAHPQAGIAGGIFENLDGSRWDIAFRFPSLLSELEQGLGLGLVSKLLKPWVVARSMGDQPQPIDWVSGASMMVRSAVVDRIGGLDEAFFLYFEETEFCHRAKAAGFSTWYVPSSRVMHIAGQSTGVTERNAAPKRLPAYWFESRRRYFVQTRGLAYAWLTDAVAVLANGIGYAKRVLQGRADQAVPRFVRDLASHAFGAAKAPPAVPRF